MHGIDRQQRQALAHLAAAAAVEATGPAAVRACDDAALDRPRPPFVLAARSKKRDVRRAHGGGEMHRHRIDADEKARARRERAELLQRELAREVERLRGGTAE